MAAPQQTSGGGLTAWAIHHPVGTLALTALVIVVGLFFVGRLAVDLMPEIVYPQLRITVNAPGSSPQVLEHQVTRVLEQHLAATEHLQTLEGGAAQGRAHVRLVFDYGTDMDQALQDATRNLELARTQLPDHTDAPRVSRADPSAAPIFELGIRSDRAPPMEVRDWVEDQLIPQLQTVPGVGGVEAAGGERREVQLFVDPLRLHHFGLRWQDLEDTLGDDNVEMALGQITSPTFDVMSRIDARLHSPDDLDQLRLRTPSDDIIALHEVLSVADEASDQRVFARLDGAPATRVSITKLPDANTAQVIDDLNDELHRLERSGFLPDHLHTEVTRDQSFIIHSALGAVTSAALFGGALAMVIVLLFLGSLRQAFVVGLTIPVAMLATFAMMGLVGLHLNIMTLGGLALGIGLLIDNAIVILENIDRHHQQLDKPRQLAALDGAREVQSAIFASTMTNVAAVLPFLLLTSLAALLFRELIATIAFALLASLIASLTLVPMLSALLARIRFQSSLAQSGPIRLWGAAVDALRRLYLAVANAALARRLLVLALALAALLTALHLGQDLPRDFLPPVDDGDVSVFMQLPSGTPPERTQEIAEKLEALIDDMPHVQHAFGLVGGTLRGGVVNERDGRIRYSVQLTPASERPDMSAQAWTDKMDRQLDTLTIAGARSSARPPRLPGIRTSPDGSSISLAIVGDDLDELDDLSDRLLPLLDDIPGLVDLDRRRSGRAPMLSIAIDRDAAADRGLTASDIGHAAQRALRGTTPSRLTEGNREYDLRLRLPLHTDDLRHLLIDRPDGAPVALHEVAAVTLTEGPSRIERENRLRVLRLSGDVNTEVSTLAAVNQAIADRIADQKLPDDFRLLFGGEQEIVEDTARETRSIALLALFLVLVVLALQYERIINPLLIVLTAPLALIGVVALLLLLDMPLSAPVLLGAILLIGIVVNNAILLVEYIELHRQTHQRPILQACLAAAAVRFCPILMTSLTTVIAILPLALGHGDGAELLQPLAIATIGGLLASLSLTLLVLPALYLTVVPPVERFIHWITPDP